VAIGSGVLCSSVLNYLRCGLAFRFGPIEE
jgi:hypothetical protein